MENEARTTARRASFISFSPRRIALSGEPPQHVLQDAAVSEIIELIGGIDPADQRHALESAIGGHDFRLQPLMWLEIAMQAANGDLFVTTQSERLPRRALFEHQRNHAHADQIGTMDALKRLRDHRPDAEQHRTLGRPIARRAGAVFLAGEYHE